MKRTGHIRVEFYLQRTKLKIIYALEFICRLKAQMKAKEYLVTSGRKGKARDHRDMHQAFELCNVLMFWEQWEN